MGWCFNCVTDLALLSAVSSKVRVLFVDICGYTQLAERLDADEIFSTLNRHTEEVSTIVGQHGGSVVEFHGDGLMAVFGAPRAIERKEVCADAAAREVIAKLETRERAGAACAGFLLHRAQRIRGRSEPIDLWVLPLEAPAAERRAAV